MLRKHVEPSCRKSVGFMSVCVRACVPVQEASGQPVVLLAAFFLRAACIWCENGVACTCSDVRVARPFLAVSVGVRNGVRITASWVHAPLLWHAHLAHLAQGHLKETGPLSLLLALPSPWLSRNDSGSGSVWQCVSCLLEMLVHTYIVDTRTAHAAPFHGATH